MTIATAPLVSVIVPNFEHAAYLRQRLDSIFSQTVSDIELILLDDASTDGSPEILRAYASDPRVTHLVVNEGNSGSAFKQWRKGLALARGTWIWFAESDDSCAPELLERLLAVDQRENNSLGLVYSQSEFINDRGMHAGSMRSETACFEPDPFAQDFVMDAHTFVTRYLKVKNIIPNASAVLVRRSLLADDRIWEGISDMKLCGDWLLWTRLLRSGSIGYVGDDLNSFRHHAATTRRFTSIEKKQRRVLEEVVVRSALSAFPGIDQRKEERAMYHRWFQYFTYKEIFSPKLDTVRISGRTRFGFLRLFLSFKWKTFWGRMMPAVSSSPEAGPDR